MEAQKDSSRSEKPQQISMDQLDYNFTQDATTADTQNRSPSILQEEQTLPQSVSQTMEADSYVHPGPSSRARTDSTSSESSSSSSSTSSSSSSSSASESGKDFSPDETDCDPDYKPPTPPRGVIFSPTPMHSSSEQLVEEDNLGLPEENQTLHNLGQPEPKEIPISSSLGQPEPEENQISNKRKRKGYKNLSIRQNAQRLRNMGQQYTSVSKLKKVMPQKQMGPPCGNYKTDTINICLKKNYAAKKSQMTKQ
ncbi:integrator complex subunit 6 homolog [Vanessa cardui]|uniref:integrator complex subunit 6 homolog n=1 Tax=Vanessa cardui TaxID=171605 RepID=UPI001F145543|nr:integrator complex subunit 6 homolog [Vanessa cardui]